MLSYVYFGTNNLDRAIRFYDATLAPHRKNLNAGSSVPSNRPLAMVSSGSTARRKGRAAFSIASAHAATQPRTTRSLCCLRHVSPAPRTGTNKNPGARPGFV
jgi:hypothetical protein